ncbi:glycogen synthase GlgA [Granulosicoccaceae sp. 1_MG-2023]|nr:glycogen synthase GlgA [Granulosicoccaceae sp. 1_MG-2023]
MKTLFVTSEVFPLNKTGGLGDVAYSLPHALHYQGADIRLILPAYRDVLGQMRDLTLISRHDIDGDGCTHSVRLLQARHEDFELPLYLVDCQPLFDRPGNPYNAPHGEGWHDNAERFTVFARLVALVARNLAGLDWQPQVVHCNDWQSGLVPALLSDLHERPRSVFTIHNLAYTGQFPAALYQRLRLPETLWHPDGLEFYGDFSMLKAGLQYADIITTVSPTYAREICSPQLGHGLDGVLRARGDKLCGILNGVDGQHWNPQTDTYLPAHFSADKPQPGKRACKAALREYFFSDQDGAAVERPLFGFVGRMVGQKGIDLILDVLEDTLTHSDADFVFLGSGQREMENRLQVLAARYPQRVGVSTRFSETLAHLIEAGADCFLMPSRFEPCGLNQMYSMIYGTPPIVNRTGGLADTVTDTNAASLNDGTATGFVMPTADAASLADAIARALEHYQQPALWQQIMHNGMTHDFSWGQRARQYLQLYST